jgi:hypothetical protein
MLRDTVGAATARELTVFRSAPVVSPPPRFRRVCVVLTVVQAAVSYAERCAAEREAVAAADRALAALQRQQAMLEAEVLIRPV